MPSSRLGSPSDRRSKSARDQRVSFNLDSGIPGLPEEVFRPALGPLGSSSSSSAFAEPGLAKPKHHHRHHHHHHAHPSTHQGAQRPSRRARVDDLTDSEDDDGNDDGKAKDRGTGKDKAAGQGGPVPAGQHPFPPPGGTSAAAGTAAFHTLVNPALGPNAVYTHQHLAQPPQGYNNIHAFPTFVQQGTPGVPFPMATTTMDPYSGATGISFLPAVPDATHGPMMHTYVPRNDPPGVGGIYLQQQQQHPGGFPGHAVPYASMPIATSTAPMVPLMTTQQPMLVPQPSVAYGGGGGGCGPPPVMMMPGGAMGVPGGSYPAGYPGMVHPEPALGVGQTPAEVMQEQLEFAYANNMYEPQDFKPADDDVSRFYWVREQDGNWTQRSRATIDHIGCRWYITDTGVFYAVRLPD